MHTSPRSFYLDRLRVVLTALVILHHTAITYGGSGGWFYREVSTGSSPTSLVLTVFCSVNQSFFMGMFFLLAGYFTPASLMKKGATSFTKERLIRLGIPLVVFGFILGPLTVALAAIPKGADFASRWMSLLQQGSFVIGPLWFAWALLLFAAGFALWRRFSAEPQPDHTHPLPHSLAWLYAALAVGALALGLRQLTPVGENVLGLQLGYFASYVFLFVLGCVSSRYRWLDRVERPQARRWLKISLACIPILFVTAAFSGALAGKPINFNGGFSLPAIVYAFWEPFVAWGLIAWLLVMSREKFNTSQTLWESMAAQAYGAFIVHAPVLVAISVAVSNWGAPPALKFILVGSAGIAVSFSIAALLLKLPLAKRVL